MIAGKEAHRPGEAKNSWLTGTAAWNFTAMTQYILGIRPQFEGLLIDPCIPSAWRQFTVKRTFRNKLFDIKVENHAGVQKGVKEIIVNGEKQTDNLIPLNLMKEKNKVHVVMG
jgi:cellobiose phosphorylase